MAKKDINYENNIDMALNSIKNVVIDIVSVLPATVTEGRIVSMAGDLYIGKGSAYVKLGDAGDIAQIETRVEALEGTVGDSTDGLVKDVADLQSEVETSGTGLLDRVTAIEGAYASKVIVTAGTGLKTTINSEGIVTGVAPAGTSDLSDWATVDAGLVHTADLINASAGASDAGKAIKLNSAGKIDNTMIPPLAIAEYVGTVDAKSKLTTLSTAEKGDIAKVEGDSTVNNNGVYFLTGTYDTLSNWIQIVGPSNVVSVNGESGVVVLDASDVGAIDASFGPETTLGNTDAKIPTSKAVGTELAKKVDALTSAPVAGQYTKVTINADGLVTAGTNLVASDIPDIAESQVTGLTADLASKLDDSQLVTSFGATPSDDNIASEKLVKDTLDTKVDKVTGYSLVADTEITKLAGIQAGAQVNVIEEVQVNGTPLTPTSKAVNVTVPTKVSDLTNDSNFATQTEAQGYVTGAFVSQAFTTASDGTGGFVYEYTATGGTPFMAQVLNASGDVVMASITIGASKVTVNTNAVFSGTLKVLVLPSF